MFEKSAPKSIAERYPLLAERWDEELNNFSLADIYVIPARDKKFYWKCVNGLAHSYQATFQLASSSRSYGCSICSNKQVLAGFNDLAFKFPNLKAEWSDRNTKKADAVGFGSGSRAWWKCNLKHEWKARIETRTGKGTGCPICANKQVLAGFNDLASKFPHLKAEWSPKNPKKADEVVPGSGSRAWWKCNLKHEWKATIKDRTGQGNGCPICSNQQVLAGFNDLASKFPHLKAEWSDINTKEADEVVFGSSSRAWWKCSLKHEWKAVINNRTGQGNGCPVCSNRQVLAGFNDLASKFASIAAEWSDKNPKKANEVVPGSDLKAWWKCNLKHEWKTKIVDRTGQGVGCPVCSNKQVLAGFNDLAFKFPNLKAEWSDRNTKKADAVGSGSHDKAWWKCNLEHEWKAEIVNRTGQGSGCPVCSNQQVLAGFNDLASKFPHLKAEWSDKNSKEANEVVSGSHDRAWWNCSLKHEWQATINSRTRLGTSCSKCSLNQTSKIEIKFFEAFRLLFPDAENGKTLTVPWKKNKQARIDIWFTQNDGSEAVIEFDGAYFHDGRCSNKGLDWHLNHDGIKTIVLLNAGFTVVRIRGDKLPHLKMSDPNLFQVSHDETKGDIGATVSTIFGFLNSK